MPLMGSFYVGTAGLQTAQNALHTTAHNLSNIETQGYSRQQVVQSDKRYNTVGRAYISTQQVGLGVSYAKVRQVRDFFLDKSFRLEAGRSSFYDESYKTAMEIETLLGEMEGVEFQESLNDMWDVIQELKNNPTNATNQGMFVNKANSFIERAQAVYNGLSSYQDTLNVQIKDTVDQINDYGDKIWDLNRRIVAAETGGQESANDLRDARNEIIDELSKLGKVTTEEDIYGAVTVTFENVDFVTRTYVNPVGVVEDTQTGFYNAVWPRNHDAPIYNMERPINSDIDTDVGGLKALLLLRGDDRGTYLDIPVAPDKADFYDSTGAFDQAAYDAASKAYEADVETYNKTVNKSLLQNTMAEFDKLVHGIVTAINDVLNPKDADGRSLHGGVDVFLRTGCTDDKQKLAKGEGNVPIDETEPTTLYTTSNIKINPLLLQQYTYLGCSQKNDGTYTTGFMTEDMEEDHSKSDALAQLFKDDFDTLNPNVSTPSTFLQFYNNLVGEISITGNVYKNMSENQTTTVDSINSARQQVVGVSDNEELSNMIMFQNAYNAASRYINAVNDMLGTLIQTMGV